MEEDVDGDLADIEALNYDDLDTVSKLQKTQRYNDIMQVIILSIIFTFTAASLPPCWFG
jgi:glycosylphosphatidylinositol transamidase (GPIT) subunit GPI8